MAIAISIIDWRLATADCWLPTVRLPTISALLTGETFLLWSTKTKMQCRAAQAQAFTFAFTLAIALDSSTLTGGEAANDATNMNWHNWMCAKQLTAETAFAYRGFYFCKWTKEIYIGICKGFFLTVGTCIYRHIYIYKYIHTYMHIFSFGPEQ